MCETPSEQLSSRHPLETPILRHGETDLAVVQDVHDPVGLAFADTPNTLMIARGDRARAQRMTESGARFAKLGRRYSHVLVAEH